MYLNGVIIVPGVAAGEYRADRDVEIPRGLEYEPVPHPEPLYRDLEIPKAIVLVRVGARDEHYKLGPVVAHDPRDMFAQPFDILAVPGHIAEAYVQVARGLEERVVVFLMYGERKDVLIAREDMGRAVTVMQVAVHYERLPDAVLFLHLSHGYGDVIKDAETFPMVREGVVEPAAYMYADPVLKGDTAGEYRAAHTEIRGTDQVLRIGKLQRKEFLRRERAVLHLLYIGFCVNKEQVVVGGLFRFGKIGRAEPSFADEPVVDEPVLHHGKYMLAQV